MQNFALGPNPFASSPGRAARRVVNLGASLERANEEKPSGALIAPRALLHEDDARPRSVLPRRVFVSA